MKRKNKSHDHIFTWNVYSYDRAGRVIAMFDMLFWNKLIEITDIAEG